VYLGDARFGGLKVSLSIHVLFMDKLSPARQIALFSVEYLVIMLIF
jgi:hypothetical protein